MDGNYVGTSRQLEPLRCACSPNLRRIDRSGTVRLQPVT